MNKRDYEYDKVEAIKRAKARRGDIIKAYKEYEMREFELGPMEERYFEELERNERKNIIGLMYTEASGGENSIDWLEADTPLQVSADISRLELIYEVDGVEIYREDYYDVDDFIEMIKSCDFQSWYDQILDVIYSQGDRARDYIEQVKKQREEK